jgi:predicted nuclease with TOPRIM domain
MTNEVVSKIEQLKSIHKAETSEQLFQIDDPIDYQCPKFDELSKKAKNLYKTSQLGRYEEDDNETLRDKLSEIAWDSSDLEEQIEELRDAIVSVRQWGDEWKKLAKKLIEENDIDLEKYV